MPVANRHPSSAQAAIEVMASLIARVEDSTQRADLQKQSDALARLLEPGDDFDAEAYLRNEVLSALDD